MYGSVAAAEGYKMASQAAGSRPYDLVVFGATGYTGQYVVEEVARVARMEDQKSEGAGHISWAVAGRSEHKLKAAIDTAMKETGLSLASVGVITADVEDQDSLNKMAAQSSVVINCVGPYQLYGEQVVRACVENGASHVDISGEPQFLEGMQLKYNKAAEEAGVYIVGACGYDSIPADVGLAHMVNNFKGELNSAQMFVESTSSSLHTGTLESAALISANSAQKEVIRRQLFPKPLPEHKYQVARKGALHKNEELGLWGVTFPTDEPVVQRTQHYRHSIGLRPLQFQQFVVVRSVCQGVGLILSLAYFSLLCYFSWTRKLLLKYPEALTCGFFKRAGATREELKKVGFTATLIGRGWSQRVVEESHQHTQPPDSSIMVKVSGPDPGYGATSLMMVASAVTILRHNNLSPPRGGVTTPGVAFAKTDLMERLVERGMTITVEHQN